MNVVNAFENFNATPAPKQSIEETDEEGNPVFIDNEGVTVVLGVVEDEEDER